MTTCRDCETSDLRCQVCREPKCWQHHDHAVKSVSVNGNSRKYGFVHLIVCPACRRKRLTVRIEERA